MHNKWIKTLLSIILMAMIIVAVALAAFAAGREVQTAKAESNPTALVCTTRITEIRTNPTGFILVRLAKGSQLMVTKVEAPFAYVAYFDGKQWVEGSITASYLGPCQGNVDPNPTG